MKATDQFGAAQIGLLVRTVARFAMERGEWHGSPAAGPGDLHACVQRDQGLRKIAGISGDAVVRWCQESRVYD